MLTDTGAATFARLMDVATDDCVLWPRGKHSKGYGMFRDGGRNLYTHREACRLTHGEPPSERHQAAHSCGVRSCMNARHLRWATQAENDADKWLHGTQRHGETHPAAKLTDADVRYMRAVYTGKYGEQTMLAAMFGVASPTVSNIVNYKQRIL